MIEYEENIMLSIKKDFEKCTDANAVFRVHRKSINWLEFHYFKGLGCDEVHYKYLRRQLHDWKSKKLLELDIASEFGED